MTTATATPPALRALGLDDPARYRIHRRVPIFDEHEPTIKYVSDSTRKSPTNPHGTRAVSLGATRADLEQLARNSNARAATGRLPSLQLGHSLPYDAPESLQPRAVGFPFNFTVGEHGGKACLFADLAYRAAEYAEAATYPRGSIERSNWTDPALQHVQALALIRGRPGCDLPPIPYSAGPGAVTAGESVNLFGSDGGQAARVRAIMQRQNAERVAERQAREAAEATARAAAAVPSFTNWASRQRISDLVEARRLYAAAFPTTPTAIAYAAEAPAKAPARRPSLVEFAVAHQIFDPELARQRYAQYHPDPTAPAIGYDAGSTVVSKLPTDERQLMTLRQTPAFQTARRIYSTLVHTYSVVQAGADLEREVRAGLVGFDATTGALRYPEAPLGDNPATQPSDREYYLAQRAAFWKSGGVVGPSNAPRFAQVNADDPGRVTASGSPRATGGPVLSPRARSAMGLDVDFGRNPNAVAGPTDPNPRLPGR